jgi:hypothetical protein
MGKQARLTVAGADPLIESLLVAGLVSVSCLWLLGASFHPWAAQFRPIGETRNELEHSDATPRFRYRSHEAAE